MQKYQTIFINGHAFNCDIKMSLKDLLLYLNFNINNIIVEYNKKIITTDKFDHIFLSVSDNLEIITIVGGG
uniref:Thiamin biosynthesis protein S n=1 Tax=Sphondylothamnion multifidum TaxID=193186 RepID=A0A4D6WYS3_9FLOR|nr:Thiamin biosynthesis protein S [Sphondylothamnion multifidum]